MTSDRRSRNEYTIGWVCALANELTAAIAMLDHKHPSPLKNRDDLNTYAFGSIGGHNIVIACLPEGHIGTNSAAIVATRMMSSFPSIKFGLMVGIGGSMSPNVRLGDVVISTPAGSFPGVVQWDLGSLEQGGGVKRIGSLNNPPNALLMALSHMRASHDLSGSRIPSYLEELGTRWPRLVSKYLRSESLEDTLFETSYEHEASINDQSCRFCDRTRVIHREARHMLVHYGLIASGNRVIKNATLRDQLNEQYDGRVLCVEMEAAGLMNSFPCIVIRGICDYADSHKNDMWQEHAAAMAAACAKEFLNHLRPSEVDLEPVATEIMQQTLHEISKVANCIQSTLATQGTEKDKECLRDMYLTDPRDDKTRIEKSKGGLLKSVYRWILNDSHFLQWRDDDQRRLLWVKGDPGKGKTMLLCGIIDELKSQTNNLAYFFCQGTDSRLNCATAVLRGLIFLLLVQQPSLFSYVRERYEQVGKPLFEDTNAWEALTAIFRNMIKDSALEDAVLVIDALDECEADRSKLLDLITSSTSRIKWVVSSRNRLEIEEHFEAAMWNSPMCLELNREANSAAVCIYIEHQVKRLTQQKRYDDETREAVQQHLVSNANDTFLWVALVCQQLADPKVRKWQTLQKLNLFPPGLDSLYKRMMREIGMLEDAELYRQVLAVASVTYRPITLNELPILVQSLEACKNLSTLEDIIKSCSSFLTIREGVVYFVHQSAKDFLVNETCDVIMPLGVAWQHKIVLSRSIDILEKHLRRDIYSLLHPGCHVDRDHNPNSGLLSPIGYPCIYWVDHLRASHSTGHDKDLSEDGPIYRFLENKLLQWLEALSLLRHISEGKMAIWKLNEFVKNRGSHKLRGLIKDAHRFILSHGTCIEYAPLQVYASALIFSPTRSEVKNLFAREMPEWIESKPVIEERWSACLQTLEGHNGVVWWVAGAADVHRIVSGSSDHTAKVWDAETGTCLQILDGHDGAVFSVAITADGLRVISGSGDHTAKIWDVRAGICLQTLEGHSGAVRTVLATKDNQQVISGSDDYTIKIWDVGAGTCLKTLDGHSGAVFSVAETANAQRIISGSDDHTIKVWDTETGICLRTLEDHSGAIWSVAVTADCQRVISGSWDNTVKIWDTWTTSCLQILEGHSGMVSSVAVTADSQRIISGSGDHTVKIWDAKTATCLQTLAGHNGAVFSVAVIADGQRVVSGSDYFTAKIWDARIEACPQNVEGHNGAVWWLMVSADGQQVISGSDDCTIKIWDIATGTCLRTLKGHNGTIWSAMITADGQRVVSGSDDHTVKVWDIATGRCLQTHVGHNGKVFSVAITADGKRLASASADHTVKVWDAGTGTCRQTLKGHSGIVWSVAVTDDGQRIVSGSWDLSVKIWDARTGTCLQTLEDHNGIVFSVAITADGQRVASGSGDYKVNLWDVDTGTCLARFQVGKILTRLAFDPITPSRLSTDIGVLNLRLPSSTDTNVMTDTWSRVLDFSGYSISHDDTWVLEDNKDVLWLPPEYRPSASAVEGRVVAIGCLSGRVLIIRFSAHRRVAT